jgi:uncharacterized membrane protein YidH (DUF202 family)
MDFFQKYKPGVTRRTLLIILGLFWGFAAYRILRIGIRQLGMNPYHIWIRTAIGLIGFVIFFRSVFWRVVRRHKRRIMTLAPDRPCVFSFFNWKNYLVMLFMVTMGIVAVKLSHVPPDYLGVFYISLGLSLLASALYNIYHWIRYPKELNIKEDDHGVSFTA